jgi:hypothetical protein
LCESKPLIVCSQKKSTPFPRICQNSITNSITGSYPLFLKSRRSKNQKSSLTLPPTKHWIYIASGSDDFRWKGSITLRVSGEASPARRACYELCLPRLASIFALYVFSLIAAGFGKTSVSIFPAPCFTWNPPSDSLTILPLFLPPLVGSCASQFGHKYLRFSARLSLRFPFYGRGSFRVSGDSTTNYLYEIGSFRYHTCREGPSVYATRRSTSARLLCPLGYGRI